VGSAMTGRRGLGTCAIGAVDMALWDLRGKFEGKPAWQVMGGAAQPAVTPCLAPARRRYPGRLRHKFRAEAKRPGFRALKLEVRIKGRMLITGCRSTTTARSRVSCAPAAGSLR
jgi:L-rhamnonate dehydratase